VTVLVLVSGLVVTAAGGGSSAQPWLSALWAAAGATVLVAGLVTDRAAVRRGALALLAVTIGKVFILDLASLETAARAASLLALGGLLLPAGWAWQRLRPRTAAT
jgi:uncharacterized membrane protein